jgi:hypothetical protein
VVRLTARVPGFRARLRMARLRMRVRVSALGYTDFFVKLIRTKTAPEGGKY